MHWTDWACLGIVLLGFLLLLFGANLYNDIVGWTGVYLFIGGIITYLIIYIYRELSK